jgi:hypothetical protein
MTLQETVHGHLFEGMTMDGAIEEALRLFSDDLDNMTTDSASVEVIK